MQAPLKKKLLGANHSQYVTKTLRKAIMRRSKLEKIYLTEITQVCDFADDTTFYVCDKNLSTLINRLEHDTTLAVE